MNQPHSPSTSFYYFHSFFEAIERQGVAREDFIQAAAIQPEILENPDARVSIHTLLDWFELAMSMTQDPFIALRMGEFVHPSNYGAIGQAMMSCSTVGQAMELGVRFERLLGDMADSRLHFEGNEAVYEVEWFEVRDPTRVRPLAEQDFSSCLYFAKFLARQDFHDALKPNWVSFQHALPEGGAALYQSVFGDRVTFEADRNCMAFDAELLQVPARSSAPEFYGLIVRQMEHLIENLTVHPLSRRVAIYIREQMAGGLPNVEAVADHFEMSLSTFQRRLKEEGTHFKDLCTSVRKMMAEELLSQPRYSLFEVALLLGYTESSSFHRAFKGWFGETPQAYRSRYTQEDGE